MTVPNQGQLRVFVVRFQTSVSVLSLASMDDNPVLSVASGRFALACTVLRLPDRSNVSRSLVVGVSGSSGPDIPSAPNPRRRTSVIEPSKVPLPNPPVTTSAIDIYVALVIALGVVASSSVKVAAVVDPLICLTVLVVPEIAKSVSTC